MTIGDLDVVVWPDLEERLRLVPLKHIGRLPYEGATFLPADVSTDRLSPAQRYVLKADLKKIEDLRKAMLDEADVDILRMDFAIDFTADGVRRTVLPPIVEWSPFDQCWLICDGLHRIAAARAASEPVSVILVNGVDRQTPYYALPNENGWDDVLVADTVPDRKKTRRIVGSDLLMLAPEQILQMGQEHRILFRDFNAVFDGLVTGHRTAGDREGLKIL